MARPPSQIPNYHYAHSEDGMLAVEMDAPCEGSVTLTWAPQEYPGKKVEVMMPADLFASATESYLRELAGKPRKTLKPQDAEPATA